MDAAADRIREAAKWLLVSFGGVGVVVATGVALSDLGAVQSTTLSVFAVLTVLLALIGVVVAILAAGSVVNRSFVTLAGVAAEPWPDSEKSVNLAGFASVTDLNDAYVEATTTSRLAAESLLQHKFTSAEVKEGDTEALLKKHAEAAAQRVSMYNAIAGPLLRQASFLRVSQAYEKAKWGMGLGVGLTALGLLAFVLITSRPVVGGPVVGDVPTDVTIVLTDEGERYVAATLGKSCTPEELSGTAIDHAGETTVVAVPTVGDCREGIIRISPDLGSVRAVK